MRERYYWTASAGGARWPDDVGGLNLPPFNWVKIDNRGANDVTVGVTNPAVGDDMTYLVKVKSGKTRVFNIAGPERMETEGEAGPSLNWSQTLDILCAAAGATTLLIEIADHPIVDMIWTI